MDMRGGGGGGGGREYQNFPSRIFCLTVPKNSVGEPINVSKKLGFRKNLCTRRTNHYFPLNLFGFTVPKNAVGESSSLSLISDLEKFYA